MFFAISITSKAQTLQQQVFSSTGGMFNNNTFMLSWTVGEVVIDTYTSQLKILTQGFHQPSKLDDILVNDSIEFYNGFSPNGDGINDYWKIPVLLKYPINRVIVSNRWGSEVWRADKYDNKAVRFIGKNMNEEDLVDGTYLYEIIYGLQLKKGWVFIKR